MKRNNKALYELIMRKVSREVKRTLNEAENSTSNVMYVNSNITCYLTEDDFEEGENPDTTELWTETNFKRKASSIQELVRQIGDFYNCNDSIVIYDNFVLMTTTTDEHARRLTDDQIELWKAGEIKGYSLEVRFNVYKQEMIMHDELVANGYESYD